MNKVDKIFREFIYAQKLRFNEIEKRTGIRSNELAYYLKRLVNTKILTKEGEHYFLTPESEKDIPFFRDGITRFQLAIILVRVFNEDGKVLLIKRAKRPYKDLWSLPGGCMLLGESISDAVKRVVKEKTFLEVQPEGLYAISHDLTIKEDEPIHGFILLLVKAKPITNIKETTNMKWFDKKDIPEIDTIPSDYYLATGKFNKIECKEFLTTK